MKKFGKKSKKAAKNAQEGAMKGVSKATKSLNIALKKSGPKELIVHAVQVFDVAPREVTLFWSHVQVEEEVEYRVKYSKRSLGKNNWQISPVAPANGATIQDLKPRTLYLFSVQARKVGGDFGPDSKILEVRTGTVVQEERKTNFERTRAFIDIPNTFSPYPEPEVKPDTVFNKAERAFDAALVAADHAGVIDQPLQLLKKLYDVRKAGLSALMMGSELTAVAAVLASQLVGLSKKMKLTSQQITVGTYYHFWQNMQKRIKNPNLEFDIHHPKAGNKKAKVLASEAPTEICRKMAQILPLTRLPYRSEPTSVQWVLRGLKSPMNDFDLVCHKGTSGPQKPAFCVFANRKSKVMFLSVRGTAEVEDLLTNHSFKTDQVALDMNGTKKVVELHHGFFQASKWLLSAGKSKASGGKSKKEAHEFTVADVNTIDGAGLFYVVESFAKAGFEVNITGHSLGAGVSTVLGLVLASMLPKLSLSVYGFATPCAVDKYTSDMLTATAAQKMKLSSKLPKMSKQEASFFGRLNYMNFVKGDDMVPRLSYFCLQGCAKEIQASKHIWSKYLTEDKKAMKKKALTFWAPNQRALSQNQVGTPMKSNSTNSNSVSRVAELEEDVFEPESDGENRQYIAGPILHTYIHNGVEKASIVTCDFEDFNKIMAFPDMVSDHLVSSIGTSLNELFAVSNAQNNPPKWEPGEVDKNGRILTTCVVCNYNVGWNSSIGAGSGAQDIKSARHCRMCGKMACPSCASQEIAIPKYGISRQVAVCDSCFFAESYS